MIFNSQFYEPITYATVLVYGAASEIVTLTHSDGTSYEIPTASNGVSSTSTRIVTGTYTISASVSNFSGSVTVTTSTTRINAWPAGATIYYWYGYAPLGDFASAKAVPSDSDYTSNPTGMQITTGENSVFVKTYGNAARGGTAYLPETTVNGSTLYLVCSGTVNHNSATAALKLVVTSSISNKYNAAVKANITEGKSLVTASISSISGGSYYVGITGNTSVASVGTKQTSTTVKAIYSI